MNTNYHIIKNIFIYSLFTEQYTTLIPNKIEL